MKTKQELKEELHNLINSIDDEEVLTMLNEEVVPYVIENRKQEDRNDELTKEQEAELNEAIRQADAGETVSWAEFLKVTERWHTK